jgi:5-methylcytosine-specific restriction enzyme A
MPTALARACTSPGCPNVSTGGKCASCRKSADKRRGSASARGYGRRWADTSRTLRRTTLRYCGDRMPGAPSTSDSQCPQDRYRRTIAQVVDHIIPVTGPSDPNFWKAQNWQGLCHACHNRKRQRESLMVS